MDREEYLRDREVLGKLSLEELWQLFPIVLTPYREEWKEWAGEEIARLSDLLRSLRPVITHIGSTSIPGIYSKPIIDLLVEVPGFDAREDIIALMEAEGYICMSSSDSRLSFNKGYTRSGYAERVFHVHFRSPGDNDEILFRDYLREHDVVARQYEELKLSLLPRLRNDRDGYTAAKGDFISNVLKLAREKNFR